jgi:5-methylthioadenosine/S-adenosylhomocysteine deaminase
VKTLISGAVILTCDSEHTVIPHGDLVFDEDRITYVGPSYDGQYDIRIPATGKLLLPGLINAHTHSGMSIFRSLADDVDLMVFLEERVWPRETKLCAGDVYAGSLLSSIEMLKAGVTTSVDMYFFEDALVRAAVDSGARTLITPTVLDVPAWTPVLGSWEKQLERALAFCRQWEGHAGRIHTGVGPHAPYTLSLDALVEIAGETHARGLPVNIHLVETEGEREQFNSRRLGSTVSALQDVGFFNGPTIAAHSIWLDDGDIEIFRHQDVGVAHCPQSNAKLAAGVAPVVAMLRGGVHVGLGTDGAATNNNHDLWEEVRLAPLLQKLAHKDPKQLPAPEALWMATRIGALAAHLDELGVLATGFHADVVMLDIGDTQAVPIFGPETYISHAVYAFGSRMVESVWVEGRQVVKDGEILTVDEERARAHAQSVALDLSARAGVVRA